ncbi:MAG: 3-oxo-tetronate 4-phosphate decarboxylase [Pseudomonadota bacterium]
MNPEETRAREAMTAHGRALFDRGLAHGTAGNISIRLDDGYLVTPTNSCLGRLDPADIAKLDMAGAPVSGKPASKEAFLHLMSYRRRPQDKAVVHLHSTHAVAVACMDHPSTEDVLPPLTAYYVMRVGKLPLAPYFPPGDERLARAVAEMDADARAVLLANHGPIVSGPSLDGAVYAIEELEETAKLFLMLRSETVRPLTKAQVAALNETFNRTK